MFEIAILSNILLSGLSIFVIPDSRSRSIVHIIFGILALCGNKIFQYLVVARAGIGLVWGLLVLSGFITSENVNVPFALFWMLVYAFVVYAFIKEKKTKIEDPL